MVNWKTLPIRKCPSILFVKELVITHDDDDDDDGDDDDDDDDVNVNKQY